MLKRQIIRDELLKLQSEGEELGRAFEDQKDEQFNYKYQSWYSKALKVVATAAPDRYVEFRGYYDINPKRKALGYDTYVIQDYLKGIIPVSYGLDEFDPRSVVATCLLNQVTILSSVAERIGSVLDRIEGELYAELQDDELLVATQLAKVSPRAAGALAGVVIEGHLQKVAASHGLKIGKKHPTISDLNEPLKAASVIDVPTWRKVSFLADLRNLCAHRKDTDPKPEQVDELIQGADWVTKNIF
jgi:hypothetical protein